MVELREQAFIPQLRWPEQAQADAEGGGLCPDPVLGDGQVLLQDAAGNIQDEEVYR